MDRQPAAALRSRAGGPTGWTSDASRGTYGTTGRSVTRVTGDHTMSTDDHDAAGRRQHRRETTTALMRAASQERLDSWEHTARQRKIAAERRDARGVADEFVDRLVHIQTERDDRANKRYERDVKDGRDPERATIETTIPHMQQ